MRVANKPIQRLREDEGPQRSKVKVGQARKTNQKMGF